MPLRARPDRTQGGHRDHRPRRATSLHDRLSRAGFRRSHNIAYAPVCPACNACVPIRIPVAAFQPDRTLRRIARATMPDWWATEVPARATAEQFAVVPALPAGPPWRRRHGDDEFLRLPRHGRGHADRDLRWSSSATPPARLVGACLDRPARRRPVGGLQLLRPRAGAPLARQLHHPVADRRAAELGLPYVYLGYWVPESAKMAYKARFRPSEVLAGGTWRVLADGDHAPMPLSQPAMVSQSG